MAPSQPPDTALRYRLAPGEAARAALEETFADYHVPSTVDAYSDRHYDVYWADGREPRRNGDKRVLLEISRSRGFAMVMPFKAGCLFTIMGACERLPG